MASAGVRKYALEDELNEFLAQDIATYVIYDKLSTFANELEIPRREMKKIRAPNTLPQDEQVKEVSKAVLFY